MDIYKPIFKIFEDKIKDFIISCNLEKKKKFFFYNKDPTLSFVKGSARYASMIIKVEEYDSIKLIDVTNFSIEINAFHKEKNYIIVDKIIKSYSTLPARGVYKTLENNQTSIRNDI